MWHLFNYPHSTNPLYVTPRTIVYIFPVYIGKGLGFTRSAFVHLLATSLPYHGRCSIRKFSYS